MVDSTIESHSITRRRTLKETARLERDHQPAGTLGLILATLTIAAPALGGASSLWAQALLAVATGILFLAKPASRSLGPMVNIGAFLLVLIALTAFLPAAWWPADDWRNRLENIPGLELPPTRSPQPWLTLEGLGLMVLGLSWAYYLLGHRWERKPSLTATRIFGLGIISLAMVSIISCAAGYKVPLWPTAENSGINFGFFPNRNQTANVLALGGILINALAFEDLRSRRKTSAFWFASLGVICAALIFAYSRSGIVLFFGGVLVWALFSMRVSPSIQSAVLAVSGAILLLTVLFLFGGDSLRRFQAESFVPMKDFRLLLQRDSANLASTAPLLGHGLRNFEPLFAMARSHSTMGNRAVHPESDWIWAAVELGWLAPALALTMYGVWLRKCFPLEQGSSSLLRCAAIVGAIGFACHGLVDVSGHRLGSLWPALFMMSLALHPDCKRDSQRWVSVVFRALGVVLIVIGGCWLASYAYPLPTTAHYQRLTAQIESQVAENKANEVIETSTRALHIAPLDWDLYYQRARAHAVLFSTSKADSDFAAGRTLEPNWNEFCFDEGALWLALDQPDRALDAWYEALKRPTDDTLGLYRRMLEATRTRFELRDVLRYWAREKRAFLLLFLETSSKLEFELESEQLLSEDPELNSLSSQERGQFFRMWSEHRKLADLAPVLFANTRWHAESWPYVARFHAEQGNFKSAYETVREFASMPNIPLIDSRESVPELERAFYLKSKDLVNGLTLLHAQIREGKLDDAATTIGALKQATTPPAYLLALEFDLQARRQEWQSAWHAWLAYESASQKQQQ
jgi:tetratricopeptide (TPR) repeat protein